MSRSHQFKSFVGMNVFSQTVIVVVLFGFAAVLVIGSLSFGDAAILRRIQSAVAFRGLELR